MVPGVTTRKPAAAKKSTASPRRPAAKPAAKFGAKAPAKQRRPKAAGPAKPGTSTRRTVKARPRPRSASTSKRPGPPRPGPLEASYSSTLFRSRAEARWALFFDLAGWDWDYEPCHYSLGALNYLPDFYLPATSTWVEVKGPPFLDAAAMGKLASSVAGPHPLPSRTAPYGPAKAVVIVGPITVSPGGGRAVHNLALPASEPGYAGLHRAIWELDGTLRSLDVKAWLTIPATGAKTARRPTMDKAAEILFPAPVGALGMPTSLVRAYILAAAAKFDEVTGGLAKTTSTHLLLELGSRRRGRPLGCAA